MTTSISNKAQQLSQLILQYTENKNIFYASIQGLSLHRWNHPTPPASNILDASLCLISQGRKQVILGDEVYTYDANHFLFTAVDLPIISKIIEASPEAPYLGIILRLDPYLLTELIVDAKLSFNDDTHERKGLAIGEINDAMYDCFIHLLKLLATPQDIPVLAPLTMKEIFYRLLMSPQGARLKHIAASGTTAHRIGNAIHWIKDNFAQPFQVETLASEVGMSASSFHQHFRDITSMSPLQYQKRIRLSQARRLLLTANKDITSASMEVGYLSVSQFSREYKRFFGMTPSQDMKG